MFLLACGPDPLEPNPGPRPEGGVVEREGAPAPKPDPEPKPDPGPVEVVARLPITLHVAPEPQSPGIELVPRGRGRPPPDYARFVLIDAREGEPFVEVETSGEIACPKAFFELPSPSSATLRGFIPRKHLMQVLTSDAHITLPHGSVELEIAASTPVSCDGGRCRVFAGGWSLVVDHELLPELGWHAHAPRPLKMRGKDPTWLKVPHREEDPDLSPAELRSMREMAALSRPTLRRPDSPPPSAVADLGVEAWLERLEPGLFAALEIRAEWHGQFARGLDGDLEDSSFVLGNPCAYLHSPGYNGCEPSDVSTENRAIDLQESWGAAPWTAYQPEGAVSPFDIFVSDLSRRVRWSAEAGVTLRTRDGQEIGRLLRPLGWFGARRQLDERVCLELRWLSAFQRRELCIDREQLVRRYNGPLTLTTSLGEDAKKFERAIPMAMAYDCVRQALGRDRGMAQRWVITLELDEQGELLRRRVDAGDEGSDAGFSACMHHERGPGPSAQLLRAELIVRLRKPLFPDDAW